MQITQIVYKGSKPKDFEIKELMTLMPDIEVTYSRYLPEDIKTVTDPIYKIQTIDWTWFRSLFSKDNDISCLVLEKSDLKNVGVVGHWGFYSLDGDTNHEFYMTNLGSKLDHRAKANGFSSNFVWMFVHEYLHGSVWGNTRNRETAAALVHEWEKQGVLKAELAKDVAKYQSLTTQVSLWQKVWDLVKKKNSLTPTDVLPLVERKAQLVLKEMKDLGYDMRITQGFRSIADQDALYAQGRPKGVIVTNAKGGESFHNYGAALDFVFRKEGYNVPASVWKKFGVIGKKHGFEWGGDWKRGFVDNPHLQMTLGYSLKDFQQGKVDYKKFN